MIFIDIRTAPRPGGLEGDDLFAETGYVVAIGYLDSDDGDRIFVDMLQSEEFILGRFWSRYQIALDHGDMLCGCFLRNWAIPFIIRRTWILGLDGNEAMIDRYGRLDPLNLLDINEKYSCQQEQNPSLIDIASAFGLSIDSEAIEGIDFMETVRNDREKAHWQLKHSLRILADCAGRMWML